MAEPGTSRAFSMLSLSTSTEKPFLFLDLPRELRDKIYFHLIGDQIILVSTEKRPEKTRKKIPPRQLTTVLRGPPVERDRSTFATSVKSLPLVSHKVHDETMLSLYSTSMFYFGSPNTFKRCSSKMPAEHRRQIWGVGFHYKAYRNSCKSIDKFGPAIKEAIEGFHRFTLPGNSCRSWSDSRPSL